ncbi:MAG: DnaD domain protein [Oscillospiraceae bacterium]|nr:DnaD domain protein [Oscillospiraceae bacterium]
MEETSLAIPLADVRRLLGAASGDAALVYLYLRTGAAPAGAGEALRLPAHRVDGAMASLRQLGLWEETADRPVVRRQPPVYTEADVLRATERGKDFGLLVGEAQRRLGRILSTEELKILLSLTDYLGLPAEVIGVLITYCLQRNRARGRTRAPSLRAIEKEAYHWADEGIDTLEEAAFYMQRQLERQTAAGRLQRCLQLEGRRLTGPEERYILSWLDMGFGEEAVTMAYERTCLNTGGMKWAYCNSILRAWHEKNLHTPAEIEAGDSRPAPPPARDRRVPAGSAGQGALGDLERRAMERLLHESEED